MPKPLDLRLRLLRRAGVIYNHIGATALGIQRFLYALASRKFLVTPPAARAPASDGLPAGHRQTLALYTVYPIPLLKSTGRQESPSLRPPLPAPRPALAADRAISGWVSCSRYCRSRGPAGGAAKTIRPAARDRGGRPARKPPPPSVRRAASSTCGRRKTSWPARSASNTPAPSSANCRATRLLPLATPPNSPTISIITLPSYSPTSRTRALTPRWKTSSKARPTPVLANPQWIWSDLVHNCSHSLAKLPYSNGPRASPPAYRIQ